MESWTIRTILEWTASDFARHGVDSPRLDAEVLLAHCLGVDRLALYLDMDRPLDTDEKRQFRALVGRRRDREPVAYITGLREFWSLSFSVDSSVLVPRPETEHLVEHCLDNLSRRNASGSPLIVDVGTGSGCIAVALASEREDVRVLAIDKEREALRVAKRNISAHELDERVSVVIADLLDPLGEARVDLVVSNPPYIPSAELDTLSPEVGSFEPLGALDGGEAGLDVIVRLVDAASRSLAEGGALIFEIFGDSQVPDVSELIEARGLLLERVATDFAGHARVVLARRDGLSKGIIGAP